MGHTTRTEIGAFDAESVVDAALDAVVGPLYSLVEFDLRNWNDLYVADETREMYEDEEQMRAHFERIHDYVNLDFAERDLFTEDLLPSANEVRYKATTTDVMKFVRVYVDATTGLFLALDPDEPVVSFVAAIEDAIEG